MTEEERDNDLGNLFRNKLEENEMVAGSDLTGRFMRRLDRREFLRFNPARFNVFYLAAAAAGLTVAGLLLFASPRSGDSKPEDQAPQPEMTVITDDTNGTGSQQIDTVTPEVTEEKTASGTVRAETAPGGVTDRPAAIIIPAGGSEREISVRGSGQDDASVAMAAAPIAVIRASSSYGCVPLHVRFNGPATEGLSAEWTFGDGGSSSVNNPDYIYDLPGKYEVTLTVTDTRGRLSTATTTIEAWARPSASFEISKSDQLADDDKVTFINLSAGAVQFLWNFGDGTFSTQSDPSYRYRQPGRYDVTLVAYSESGCQDSLTINDVFSDKGSFIRFPNAFMPNTGGPTGGYYNQRTDMDNQVFHPVVSGVAEYNLKIYNKSGLMVFESSDPEMGWDGYYKGEICTPGVYVWKVRGTYRNGRQIVMAGDVILLNY
ncbi:MAG TPA: PKD domain-containing protein [Bacteroidales bacterium]|nr:PKD domain-containing protein [Bacteroidales bacterium]